MRTLQRSDHDGSDADDCVDEMFYFTTNKSRLLTESSHGSGGVAVFRRRIDDADEVAYVADVLGTNLLLIVVDGRRRHATTHDTTRP